MSRAGGYRSLLCTRGAAAFFVAAAVGRVGIAMTGLGLVWLVHARTGSYGRAGLAGGGFALAEALCGPQVARLIDRLGQTRVLPCCLVVHGGAIAVVLGSSSVAAEVVAASCAGAVVPQLGALSGARWAYLLRERTEELPTAFSLESLANATAFLLGPVLVTSLGAAGDEALATAVAASLILAGGAVLAAQRRTAPEPRRKVHTGQTLLRPAFARIALMNLALGLYFGTTQVSVSAFALDHGAPAAPIVAVASVSGLLSGWVYGLRRHRTPARRQLLRAGACLTGASALLPLAPNALWLAVALALTEAAIPPTLVLLNVETERSVHPAALTQAFTWNNSASAAGSALAASLAGRVADGGGASAALALALVPAAGLLALVRPPGGRPSRRGSTGCPGPASPGRRRARRRSSSRPS
ncbi:MFS transporter [Amycolatopsis sp. DSM 110486]|nr:MFS transporter [Amycolatopsis sp. DSM 110486]QYN19508.1 MFS transporter [Amycolatopsis sp. DSM 110486]